MIKKIISFFSGFRLQYHIFFLLISPNRKTIILDIKRWSNIYLKKELTSIIQIIFCFIYLMTFLPEFRNLFYCRIKKLSVIISKIISIFCKPLSTLYISTATDNIGPGLFIQHGFSTIIDAEKIGNNCWINQQVTIGYTNENDKPVISDNVYIYAGAKVLGKIVIGNNSKIGANTVIIKDVPENCSVVGSSAYIVRKNGKKVREKL